MTRTFIETEEFSKNWSSLGFNDDDLQQLETELLENPSAFPIIKGTGGLRKMRFAFENNGKSGGVRVCYVDFAYQGIIYLITVYPKKMKDNLSMEEKNNIRKMIALIRENI